MTKSIFAFDLNGRDYRKAACGNCFHYDSETKECPILQDTVMPGEHGCLLLLDNFVDRGVVVPEGITYIPSRKGVREAHIAGAYTTHIFETEHFIKLSMEFPEVLAGPVTSLSDYNFALAPEVLRRPKLAIIYNLSGKPTYLDNGVNEEGKPCSIQDMKAAAAQLRTSLVIAPDVVGDSKATLTMLPVFENEFDPALILPVIHGTTLSDILNCAERVYERGYVRVAVPYAGVVGSKAPLAMMAKVRSFVVGCVVQMGFSSIHLLGTTSLEEFVFYRLRPEVKRHLLSIDTGMPVSLGLRGTRYPMELVAKEKSTMATMESLSTEKQLEDIFYNIAFLRTLL